MTTLNTKSKYYKKVVLLSLLLAGTSAFYACSDEEEPHTKPEPQPETVTPFKYQAMDISEFKQISAGNTVQELPASEAEKYFGRRIVFASPKEIQLKEDSLYIIKPGGLTEGYKIKWEDTKLFLYKDGTASWEYCGTQKSDNEFLLNTGFYIKKSQDNTRRILTVTGQEYALENYSDIADDASATTWLKATYTFKR